MRPFPRMVRYPLTAWQKNPFFIFRHWNEDVRLDANHQGDVERYSGLGSIDHNRCHQDQSFHVPPEEVWDLANWPPRRVRSGVLTDDCQENDECQKKVLQT